VQWGASHILGQTRFPMHHSDNWFRSWSRIQKRFHGDARRTHGDRPGRTQDAGRQSCIREEQGRSADFVQQTRGEYWYIDFRQDGSLKYYLNTRTLMRALRGIVDQEHNPFPFATHENRDVPKTRPLAAWLDSPLSLYAKNSLCPMVFKS
jgi:hypothetical protein